MRAVLMAGGSGTRLRPLTCTMPKPLVPIVNRPIIGHIVNLLKKHHFNDVTVTLYYLPQSIQNYLGDGSEFGVNIDYAIEEDKPLGTAGCVKAIQSKLSETFVVISGDSLTDFDLTEAVAFHRAKGSVATLVLTRVENPLEYGVVITDEHGAIKRFLEKPTSSEIFSDTVNTGIYILEPEVLDLLPPDQEFDFSKDLFPRLLADRSPMYGYVAEGYWCDIGNLQTYRQAHYDALSGYVKLSIPYEQQNEAIWIGEGTVIEQSVVLEAPLIIGNNCYIGAGAHLSAFTVLGDNVTIGENSSLKRPIIWNGAYVDRGVSLRGCTIGKNATIKREAQILEGAVIGDEVAVGDRAIIKPEVRIWPNKLIQAGALVRESLIWGSGAPQNLFGQMGISGLANIDITPELAVKIGAAYGATMGMRRSVTMSRDQAPVVRLISRAMISGILSTGVNVLNLEDTPIPVSRNQLPALGAVGGAHIRIDPDNPEKISIEFLDTSGLDIPPAMEKKIESTYYKEDFRRARIHEVGEISYPARIREQYQESFLRQFANSMPIPPLKVVIDYGFMIRTVLLPSLIGKLGIESVVLNAHQPVPLPSQQDRQKLLQQLSEVVVALKADFGVQIYGNGERMILVDNTGQVVSTNKLLLLMMTLMLDANPGKGVSLPVSAPKIAEDLAIAHGGHVIRTKVSNRSLMESARTSDVVLSAATISPGAHFIFPSFHAGFDSMFGTAMLACLVAKKGVPVSELIAAIPAVNTEHQTIPCLAEQKGTVMRILVEMHQNDHVDLFDGIKIYKDKGWVLALPDPVEPVIHLYADGETPFLTQKWLGEYKGIIARTIQQYRGGTRPLAPDLVAD